MGEKNHCRVILHRGKNQKTLHPRDYVHNTVTYILFCVDEESINVIFPLSNLIKKMHLRTYLFFNLFLQNVEVKPTVTVIYITIYQNHHILHVAKENTYVIYISLLGERIPQAKPCLTCIPPGYIHNNVINIPMIRKKHSVRRN